MCTKNTDGTHSILFKANILTCMYGGENEIEKFIFHFFDMSEYFYDGFSNIVIMRLTLLNFNQL